MLLLIYSNKRNISARKHVIVSSFYCHQLFFIEFIRKEQIKGDFSVKVVVYIKTMFKDFPAS